MAFESPDRSDVRMDMGAMLGAVISRWFRILLITAVLCAATYGLLLFVPKTYEASASILVEPRNNAFTGTVTGAQPSSIPVESTISSQIELIKSRDTLRPVIEAIKLADVPEFNGTEVSSPIDRLMRILGRTPSAQSVEETVLRNLAERLSVVRERDSAFISVIVRSENPELAAELANAIAQAHVQRRAALSLSDTAGASVWLEAEIVKMRQRVEAAEQKVAEFRVDNDLFTGTNNTRIVDQQLSEISAQITAAQGRRNTAQSRATLIMGLLDAGQAIDGVPSVRDSQVIQQLSQTKATLQGERAQKLATLLPNHPSVQALTAQIREVDQQITAEGRRVASALEAEAEIEAGLIASLQAELANTKVSASGATIDTVTLDGLEREAKAQRDLLATYLARYNEALSRSESNSALPDVRVVTDASAPTVPSAPRTTMIVGAVGFVSIALQVGGILFGELLSGRALVETPRRATVAAQDGPRPDIAGAVARAVTEPPPPPPNLDELPEPADPDQMKAPPLERPRVVLPPQPQIIPVAAQDEPEAAAEPAPAAVAPHDEWYEQPSAPEPAQRPAATLGDGAALANLSADLTLGRARIVLLSGLVSHEDVEAVADKLVDDALSSGLSVALVDAGSGVESIEPGISDLALDAASFGDVVFKSDRDGFAEVPWGHMTELNLASGKPMTLVEALTDIYESVIVLTGLSDAHSSLPAFERLECRVVLVARGEVDEETLSAFGGEVLAMGFPYPQVVFAPTRQAEVA